MLYEAFSRGNKTYFFGLRGKDNLSKSRNFAWPLVVNEKGLFWNNSLNYKTFDKDLDKLIKISDKNWKRHYIKYKDKIMKYDYENKKIKNYLKKIAFFSNR